MILTAPVDFTPGYRDSLQARPSILYDRTLRSPPMNLTRYNTLVFDCDGVILDSNKVKTDAFRYAAAPYGDTSSQALVNYHTQNGGISRFAKFEFFLREIIRQPVTEAAMQELLARFESKSRQGLLECAIAPGLQELKIRTPHTRWMVVSGASQTELHKVFAQRNIDHWFDAGIYGSPDSKDEILARELASGNLSQPALFLGDSRYDHIASTRAGLDFLFISGWTEFSGWQTYCAQRAIPVRDHLANVAAISA